MMRTKLAITCAAAVVASLTLLGRTAEAQSLSYTKGQNVAPAYEGWEVDADGTKWFLFGYMNRNWVEELDVPVGESNSFSPGGPDLGQPTHFLPRRNRFVFRIQVPPTFSETDELVWTLTTNGVTEKAWASLRPDYVLDSVAKMSETGALGAGTSNPELRSNQPPTVTVDGPKQLTATAGQPLTLTAVVKDDGIPKRPAGGNLLGALFGQQSGDNDRDGAAPASGGGRGAGAAGGGIPPALLAVLSGRGTPEDLTAAADALGLSEATVLQLIAARRNPAMNPPVRITVGKVNGLHLSWFVYRGAGEVTFSPEQAKTWEDTRAGMNSPWAPLWTPPRMPADGKVVVQATFSEPGTYVLQALADDGGLLGRDSVTVTVKPGVPGAIPTAAPAPAPTPTVVAGDLSGNWDILLDVGGNQVPIAATLKQDGEQVSGTFSSPLGEMPVSGTISGNALKLEFTAETPQGELPITINGDLGADGTFSGTAGLGALGEAGWTGRRAD